MSLRTRVALIAVFVISLVGVGAWLFAQTRSQAVTPSVFSGGDIGFRVDAHRKDRTGNDIVVGQIVIRINGQWVTGQVGAIETLR